MIKVKVKMSGKHAQDYLGQLPSPDSRPQIKIQQPPPRKKRSVPSRKGT
jgi:hypothetical protein